MAETQEPVTFPVAETQEPVTFPVAETQEPVTCPVAEIQEPATLEQQSTKHDDSEKPAVAETQAPATIGHQQTTPTASTSAPEEHTMTSLLEENEFLKSELDAYRNELTMARDAYEKELNLHTLAHAALMDNREPSKEYMCRECGYIYESVGYKLLEVQIPEASTSTGI